MDKAAVDGLTDDEVYVKARELAAAIGGEEAARRVQLLPPEQARNFLVYNGS